MANFSTRLRYERLTEKWVRLTKDLHFCFTLREALGSHPPYFRELLSVTGLDPDQPIYVVAPKGFVSDLASIPKALHPMFKPDGPWAPAAVIHDIIYQSLKEKMLPNPIETGIEKLNRHHTRLLADRIFLMGMRQLDIGWLTRMSMYNAVRGFGKSSFGGIPMVSDYGVTNVVNRKEIRANYQIFRLSPTQGLEDKHDMYRTKRWDYHTVKFPNLKRAFLLDTIDPL